MTNVWLYQVAKKLDLIITQTPSVQYRIELGMAGCEDASPPGNIVSRLGAIRRERHTWKDLRLKHVKTIPVASQDWIEARSHKDIISGRVPDRPKQLDILHLGGTLADEERRRHIEFDVKFEAHYIDPGQDLIVLASLSQTLDAA